MSYQGTERRDTTAKGRAIRLALERELAYGLRIEEVAAGGGAVVRHIPTMTVGRLEGILGRMWNTAHAQGRVDMMREMREDFASKIDALLGEFGVR